MTRSGLSYDEHTALVVVDLQNDFASPSGSLYVAGGDQLLDPINDEIAAARAGGALVVFTQDWHPPETPHFQTFGGVWPIHCVRDTWGAELVDGLDVAGPVVRKGTGGEDGYSGFSMRDPLSGEDHPTGLDDLLRQHGVTRIVVVGLALDVCVRATALDGLDLGYDVTLIEDQTSPVELSPGDGAATVAELSAAGATVV